MTPEMTILLLTAGSIGFFHTLFGPDHYLPFIVISKARNWTIKKTMLITTLCGLGHVLSSVIIGLIGIALGVLITRIETLEATRGSLAAWLLISFGLVYGIWGIRKAIRNKPHNHFHLHDDGEKHNHSHTHHGEHVHVHEQANVKTLTPWILFTIFVFGPCEPLIPLLMYPAAQESVLGLILVTSVFTITTVGTMLGVVSISMLGFSKLNLGPVERYSHAIAGFTIFLCGAAIEFLGL